MIEELDLKTNFKLVSVVPLRLRGHCRSYRPHYAEHHFMIDEQGDSYRLTGDGYDQSYATLKEAVQQAYLEWGD